LELKILKDALPPLSTIRERLECSGIEPRPGSQDWSSSPARSELRHKAETPNGGAGAEILPLWTALNLIALTPSSTSSQLRPTWSKLGRTMNRIARRRIGPQGEPLAKAASNTGAAVYQGLRSWSDRCLPGSTASLLSLPKLFLVETNQPIN